jgi:hypothetical protein
MYRVVVIAAAQQAIQLRINESMWSEIFGAHIDTDHKRDTRCTPNTLLERN